MPIPHFSNLVCWMTQLLNGVCFYFLRMSLSLVHCLQGMTNFLKQNLIMAFDGFQTNNDFEASLEKLFKFL